LHKKKAERRDTSMPAAFKKAPKKKYGSTLATFSAS